MSELIEDFQTLCQVNENNSHLLERLQQQQCAMESQKVTIPIIGKFSTGKSALLNTLLGYSTPLLQEDITPKTAVPTELFYSSDDDVVTMEGKQGTTTHSTKEYRGMKLDFEQVVRVRIALNNHVLEEIPDVMLVDMPGFDSSYDLHDRAIDDYLPQSLAYIIAFSAEDMTLKHSMIRTLKELVAREMPVCIVITKRDKVTEEVLADNLKKLKADLQKHLKREDFRYCITSSREGDIEELREYLCLIQNQSQALIQHQYAKLLLQSARDTHTYLTTLMQNQNFTVSELAEKESDLNRELQELKESLAQESGGLERLIPSCISSIEQELNLALSGEADGYAAMLLNGQKIDEPINHLIRLTVTKGIQKHFVPKVQAHIESMTEHLHALVSADAGVGRIQVDTNNIGKNIVGAVVAAVGAFVLGPLLTLLGGLLVAFISNKQKEAEARRRKGEILQKLHQDVFPSVISQISAKLNVELNRSVAEISKTITDELNYQYETVSSAYQTILTEKEKENADKELILTALSEKNALVEEIIHEYE